MMRTYWEIFLTALKLGLTSFGGPAAHLGYFREEYVHKKKWLDDRSYADLIALCQFLPGPASSQAGIAIGSIKGGKFGGFLAWLGFTAPSVMVLALFSFVINTTDIDLEGFIHALKLVAVAVVAIAVWGMAKSLADTKVKAGIAIFSCAAVALVPSAMIQLAVIALSGAVGLFLFKDHEKRAVAKNSTLTGQSGFLWLLLFFLLLGIFPLWNHLSGSVEAAMADVFYRAGSLVFGGGHVVLPILEKEVVPAGWVTSGQFYAGYGAAQAVPGPLFTFAAYLGAAASGINGVLIATAAIFLPSFLLIYGTLPYWERLRGNKAFQSVLTGVNASVTGILLAALYNPLWTSTVKSTLDFSLALILFLLLAIWKLPSWLVVLAAGAAGLYF
ncbi:chromate efflux transporter [Fictibacillus iocasae]|uniref:Chromate efflux transporter n=1 Tax=Fictibacillus iocasae TaxID=2715437 RepID=A0ABW2NRC5_9BACL